MIQNDSQVKIHYTLTVDGQVVDSSDGRQPLEYVQGKGQIVPGLEKALAGLEEGAKAEVAVEPGMGYGERDPQAVYQVPKTAFQEAAALKVGDMVTGQVEGRQFQAQVARIAEDEVTLDLNHPLAGKTLNFEVEVVSVR